MITRNRTRNRLQQEAVCVLCLPVGGRDFCSSDTLGSQQVVTDKPAIHPQAEGLSKQTEARAQGRAGKGYYCLVAWRCWGPVPGGARRSGTLTTKQQGELQGWTKF